MYISKNMRALWSGSVSFGLINIPVKLYSAAKERTLSFHLLDKKDHCPISYTKVCRSDNRVVDKRDIVKGYEYSKGEYVVLTDEDFKRANAKKTSTIDIVHFIEEDEIDSKYYEKPYYLEPEKKSEKAYALLRDALKESGKVGIGRFVMRDKEHVAVIRTQGNILELIELRFQDEIRDPDDLHIPESVNYSKKEMDMAVSLIDSLTERFKPAEFKDTYAKELLKVIEEKAKGKRVRPKKEDDIPVPTDVADLLAMLKKSLDREKVRK